MSISFTPDQVTALIVLAYCTVGGTLLVPGVYFSDILRYVEDYLKVWNERHKAKLAHQLELAKLASKQTICTVCRTALEK